MWRTTPVHRWEMAGSLETDSPPAWPDSADRAEVQFPADGAGPLMHRLYRTRMAAPKLGPEELIALLAADLDQVAPSEFASFHKLGGAAGRMDVGDEYVVRMPGPWDGPVKVIHRSPTSFRLATLEGHLEAGQIEFRATARHRALEFAIESWACSGDRLSDLLYTHLRMSKEIQLHMWTSVLERVVELSGGRMEGGITVTTKRVEAERPAGTGGIGPDTSRAQQRLASLADRPLNFEVAPGFDPVRGGWRLDDMTTSLPVEPSGPPVEGGSWEVARELMLAYQVADPTIVRATYRHDAPLAGRDMLLQIRYLGLRFHVGVRVGEVYDRTVEVDGAEARVFGWDYRTLAGHFEEGQMHYEVWKWLESGHVDFRLHAYSRAARSGPLLLRLGFRLVGRRNQVRFYGQVLRRMRRLTEAELEIRERGRAAPAETAMTAGSLHFSSAGSATP
jgi:uncharacterized protein (UPF0548 family)